MFNNGAGRDADQITKLRVLKQHCPALFLKGRRVCLLGLQRRGGWRCLLSTAFTVKDQAPEEKQKSPY